MKTMTKREVFDRVEAHLLRQAKRSGGPVSMKDYGMDYACFYRLEDLRCAAGCLIDDYAYNPDLEHKHVSHTDVRGALELSGVPVDPRSMEMINDLQALHDRVEPHFWPQQLSVIKQKFFPEETR